MNSLQQLHSLLDVISDSITNDCGEAIEMYEANFITGKPGGGFFAVPRMLFPEIDGLGTILTGQPRATGLNIKTYLKDVMALIDARYATFAGFIPLVYRHGLLHQHDPKDFRYKGKSFGWAFQFQHKNNPIDVRRRWHLRIENDVLVIDMRLFYQDLLDSISLLKKMITAEMAEKFLADYNKPINKTAAIKNARTQKKDKKRYLYESDFDFLKKPLNK
jgi:hypothetical protein